MLKFYFTMTFLSLAHVLAAKPEELPLIKHLPVPAPADSASVSEPGRQGLSLAFPSVKLSGKAQYNSLLNLPDPAGSNLLPGNSEGSKIPGAAKPGNTLYANPVLTTTAPLSGGGDMTTDLSISLPAATSSVSGYLTSANWNTFNSKQAALSGTGLVKSTAGAISYQEDNSSHWDAAYTNGLVFRSSDAGTGDFNVYTTTGWYVITYGTGANKPTADAGILEVLSYAGGNGHTKQSYTNYHSGIQYVRYKYNGDWTPWLTQASESWVKSKTLLNQTDQQTDADFNISGKGIIGDRFAIGTAVSTSTNMLISRSLTGGTISMGAYINGTIQPDATTSVYGYRTLIGTAASAFTTNSLVHFAAGQTTMGAGSAVTNQYGFYAQNSMTGGARNYGFYGNIPSGTGRWNLYMNGTADNYLAGSLGIGTTIPDAKLTVNGSIHSKEVKVDLNIPGPDYVFRPDYRLISLNEVKDYIDLHQHLPDIPSAEQMAKEGLNLGEMNTKLLKKIEELTLYLILQKEETEKQDKIQQGQIDELKGLVARLAGRQH